MNNSVNLLPNMKKKPEKTRDVSPYAEKKKTKVTIDLSIRELPWTDKQKKVYQPSAK